MAPVQHVDGGRLRIEEDDNAVAIAVEGARGVGHRHQLDGLPRGAHGARHPRAAAAGLRRRRHPSGVGRCSGGLERFGLRRGGAPPLPGLTPGLELLDLVGQLVDGVGQRRSQLPASPTACRNFSPRAWRVISLRCRCFSRASTTCADTALSLSTRSSLPILGPDEAAKRGRDVEMAAGQFESHQ